MRSENSCLHCGRDYIPLNYMFGDISVCEECYIKLKMERNIVLSEGLASNTFGYIRNNSNIRSSVHTDESTKVYFGSITGVQFKNGCKNKYYLHMNVNEDDFSIWFDGWHTEEEIAKHCNSWNINIEELTR